jgi:hypothetical protein
MQQATQHHPSINFKMEPHLKNGKVYDNARNCPLQQAQNMVSIHLL